MQKTGVERIPGAGRVDDCNFWTWLADDVAPDGQQSAIGAGFEGNNCKVLLQVLQRRKPLGPAAEGVRLFEIGHENIDTHRALQKFWIADEIIVPARVERNGQSVAFGQGYGIAHFMERRIFGNMKMGCTGIGQSPFKRRRARVSCPPGDKRPIAVIDHDRSQLRPG